MKYLLLLLTLLGPMLISAQGSKTRALLQEIEGEWAPDDQGNVTYKRIIEVPELTKDQIYNRVENYFVYNYADSESAIHTRDKEMGNIVGKGVFVDVHSTEVIVGTIWFDCLHICRVDVKEGRARVLLTLTNFIRYFEGSGEISTEDRPVPLSYPVNPNGKEKNKMGKVFYDTHFIALNTLENIEVAIKEGLTSGELENDDW